MSTQPTKPPVTERDDPRRTFETAISQLQQEELLSPSQQPIFTRRHAVLSDPFSEKQALADAARALARLWNVPSAAIR
jgi:hypothetical protein